MKTNLPKNLNRTQTAMHFLRDLAEKAGPGAKLPTFNELMQQTGVSKATLSAALAQLEDARVLQRKHGVGIYVCERAHHTSIAIVFDPLLFRTKGVSPYWHLVWNALSDVAQRRAIERDESFAFHLATTEHVASGPFTDDFCDAVIQGRVDGVLAVGLSEAGAEFLARHRVPFVTHAGNGPIQVNTDGLDWVRRATQYLIEKGCRDLALFGAGDAVRSSLGSASHAVHMLHVFLEMLAHNGLPHHVDWIKDGTLMAAFAGHRVLDTNQGEGYAAAMAIFGGENEARPDGLIIRDDMMAQGALTAMEKCGVRAGRDVQVVSHANKGATTLLGYEEDIVRLEYDAHDIAEKMFDSLDNAMQSELTAPSHTLVRAEFVM